MLYTGWDLCLILFFYSIQHISPVSVDWEETRAYIQLIRKKKQQIIAQSPTACVARRNAVEGV